MACIHSALHTTRYLFVSLLVSIILSYSIALLQHIFAHLTFYSLSCALIIPLVDATRFDRTAKSLAAHLAFGSRYQPVPHGKIIHLALYPLVATYISLSLEFQKDRNSSTTSFFCLTRLSFCGKIQITCKVTCILISVACLDADRECCGKVLPRLIAVINHYLLADVCSVYLVCHVTATLTRVANP